MLIINRYSKDCLTNVLAYPDVANEQIALECNLTQVQRMVDYQAHVVCELGKAVDQHDWEQIFALNVCLSFQRAYLFNITDGQLAQRPVPY